MGTAEIVFISVFGSILFLIAVLYSINSIKIYRNNKKAQKAKEEKKEKDEKKEEKIEVKPEISAEKPLEKAIKEANVEFQIKEAFEKIEQERVDYEKTAKNNVKTIGGKLQVDRGEFKTELQKTLEQSIISSDTNKISSDTAKMDYEIATQSIPRVEENYENDIDKQIAEEYMNKHQPKERSLAEEINNMSSEAKAVLFNDILNRKY